MKKSIALACAGLLLATSVLAADPAVKSVESINKEKAALSGKEIAVQGKVVKVTKGATTAHVRLDVGGTVVTSAITNAAVDELKLAVGQKAYAVVKASDVMIAID